MFRNIIWDVDGTLFDTYPAIVKAFKSGLNDLGKDASLAWIEGLARKSIILCVSTLSDKFQLDEEDIIQEFRKHYSHAKPEEQLPFTGVIAICQYILSIEGTNVIVTHRGRESTAQLLAANNMTDYFTGGLTGDDDYPRKPDPAIFKAVIKAHNLKREETLTVGDRDIDILAGQAAGVFSCFFGEKPGTVDPDLLISNFHDLHQFLISKNNHS
jgi:phosphoglycolate phosphatase-like HAD superfamily hydrolase